MSDTTNRRDFLRTATVAGAGLALSPQLFGAEKKSVLVFTKSSGFEHNVIKVVDGKPSIAEGVVRDLGKKHGFEVNATKDGRIFDSKEFASYSALFFFTTGDLTTPGGDKNPPMSVEGKQKFLDAVHGGMGFVGIHAAADTFHTPPDPEDLSNRYIAHGEQSDPYIKMLGGEFILHGFEPRLQDTNLIVNDPKFPGLEGVKSPVVMNDEWYSLKDFSTDMHVILTIDTSGLKGNAYKRANYPMTWARMHGKGRVFYSAIGDRAENWQNEFFVNLLGGGFQWALSNAKAHLDQNIKTAAPGYAEIPPKNPPKASN
jgi:type 1 glutamine amidotransferase